MSWFVEYAIALALWFLFVAKLSLHELAVGAVAAAVAASASFVVRSQRIVAFGAYARDLVQIARIPGSLVTDTWTLMAVLARHVSGRGEAPSILRDVAFDAGEDEAHAAARRALAGAYLSITPNFIVLGFDEERRRMICHQVRRTGVPVMARRLGARP